MSQDKITHVTMPVELVNDVVNYLADRPWREVNTHLQGIFQAVEAEKAKLGSDEEKTGD